MKEHSYFYAPNKKSLNGSKIWIKIIRGSIFELSSFNFLGKRFDIKRELSSLMGWNQPFPIITIDIFSDKNSSIHSMIIFFQTWFVSKKWEWIQRSIMLCIELFLSQAVEEARRNFFFQFFSTCEKITQFLSFGKYQGDPS